MDTAEVEKMFADVVVPLEDGLTLTVRPGCQAFAFGRQRLVSPLPFSRRVYRMHTRSKAIRYTHTGRASSGYSGPWRICPTSTHSTVLWRLFQESPMRRVVPGIKCRI